MSNLKIEIWKHEKDGVLWPKTITEPNGFVYIPEWDESKIDLEFMEKYIGQNIDIYIQVGMQPKKIYIEKLIRVEKINGIWEFETT